MPPTAKTTTIKRNASSPCHNSVVFRQRDVASTPAATFATPSAKRTKRLDVVVMTNDSFAAESVSFERAAPAWGLAVDMTAKGATNITLVPRIAG
eukprot:CAMPEP_0115705312 /NCGR_PEP_ID=MMETSP0272-20121206/70146_1 /TAXON_ID=71861 /ORGANISM="Scrippsiella trochoidea, Strain CCMP3099" /LENGTH=94 /DNA_ID=CAMNT_0003146397 /DNA_START=521 /DNA_END=805 /DNA_ORIENTATION=+